MSEQHAGKIFMFDGPDGVGKTTQLALLAESYRALGKRVEISRLPGGTPIGEALRVVSLNAELDRTPLTDLYISLAIHATLASTLQAKRSDGIICLVDRSPISMIAYQAYASGLDVNMVRAETNKVINWYEPDALVYLSADTQTLASRRMKHAHKDYFEQKGEDYMSKVKQGYDDASMWFNCVIVNAEGNEQQVNELLVQTLQDKLN